LLDEYVYVSAPTEEPESTPAPQPEQPAEAAQPGRPLGLHHERPRLASAAEAGLRQQLSKLWRGLVLACLRSWGYIRGG
jgi:hypothetical protein